MRLFKRSCIVFSGLILMWELLVLALHLPSYILPSPAQVFFSGSENFSTLAAHALPTIIETLLGLMLGIVFGCSTAILMAIFRHARFWLLPILVVSQAIPTFAIAPLLVIWFGYGIAAKIITTVLMIFYPITSAFYDGLRQTDPGWLDLAKTMQAKQWQIFWHIRIPAALPNLASGIRVATVIAPIGAVVGEWVGASRGLGYLMLNANARMQIDLMFAALFVIVIFSLLLYFSVDKSLRYFITWQTEN